VKRPHGISVAGLEASQSQHAGIVASRLYSG